MSRHRDPDPHPSTERLAALVAGRTGGRTTPAHEVTDDAEAVESAGHEAAGYREANSYPLDDPYPDPGEREPAPARPRVAVRAHAAPVAAVSLPESLRGARVAVSTRALLGVVAVLLIVAGVVGARVWWAQSRSEPVPVESVVAAAPPPTAHTAPGQTAPAVPAGGNLAAGQATAAAAPTAARQVFVHVVGEVKKPGVVRVAGTARVADAVRDCGGLTGKADATSVNLARPVVDGEQVVVRAKGSTPAGLAAPAPAAATPGAASSAPNAQSPSGAGAPGPAASGPVVDLNAADQAALEALPGVGPVMAQRIVQWRAANGRFGSVDELAEVDGIGAKTLERLRPHVRV